MSLFLLQTLVLVNRMTKSESLASDHSNWSKPKPQSASHNQQKPTELRFNGRGGERGSTHTSEEVAWDTSFLIGWEQHRLEAHKVCLFFTQTSSVPYIFFAKAVSHYALLYVLIPSPSRLICFPLHHLEVAPDHPQPVWAPPWKPNGSLPLCSFHLL